MNGERIMAESKFVDIGKDAKGAKKIVIIAVILLIAVLLLFNCFAIVSPGHTGVVVTLGSVSDAVLEEGLHFKIPFIQTVEQIDNRVLKTEV